MQRLSGFDYLRGICALGIMLFHFNLWNYGVESSEGIFTRIGIYGVSIFYVLSGLTLYHVYSNKLDGTWVSINNFYSKRFFRIFPLLWLSMLLTMVVDRQFTSVSVLLSNLTGVFSFYKWDKTVTYGAWSIGNELTFYLLFPAMIYFLRKRIAFFWALLAGSFLLLVYFAFWKIDPRIEFMNQWTLYTCPLNQLFLFVAGVGMGALIKDGRIKLIHSRLVLLISLLIFIWYPTIGERVELATGFNRIVFSLISIGICVGVYKREFHLPGILDRFFLMLGHASYSLYLLHPIVYRVIRKVLSIFEDHFFKLPVPVVILIASVGTIAISYFVYLNFEKFFTTLGRKKSKDVEASEKIAISIKRHTNMIV